MSDDGAARVAVMGAVAYDIIGKTDKIFASNGPGLNCKVTTQQEFFGGCAGNIAYGLKLLDTRCSLLSLAGSEDKPPRRYIHAELGNRAANEKEAPADPFHP